MKKITINIFRVTIAIIIAFSFIYAFGYKQILGSPSPVIKAITIEGSSEIPEYIPEGYKRTVTIDKEHLKAIWYEKGNGERIVVQYIIDFYDKIRDPSQELNPETYLIPYKGKQLAVIYCKTVTDLWDDQILYWQTKNITYTMYASASIPIETMLELAKEIIYQK